MCILVPLNDKFQRVALDSPNDELFFGRSKKFPQPCQFNDSRVSTTHARIFVEKGTLYVEDKSTNGTFVNGVRVGKGKRKELKNGDELSIVVPNSRHKLAKGIY